MTNNQITALINDINDNGANTASEVRAVLTAIKNACVIPNEVKWIKITPTDLTNYFQPTGSTKGLGLSGSIYDGWAICNGNNGTTNDDGLVSIAYGINYNILGASGGSKDAVLVAHTHTYVGANHLGLKPGGSVSGAGSFDVEGLPSLSSEGVSGINKNMQPYIVELKIQRIA